MSLALLISKEFHTWKLKKDLSSKSLKLSLTKKEKVRSWSTWVKLDSRKVAKSSSDSQRQSNKSIKLVEIWKGGLQSRRGLFRVIMWDGWKQVVRNVRTADTVVQKVDHPHDAERSSPAGIFDDVAMPQQVRQHATDPILFREAVPAIAMPGRGSGPRSCTAGTVSVLPGGSRSISSRAAAPRGRSSPVWAVVMRGVSMIARRTRLTRLSPDRHEDAVVLRGSPLPSHPPPARASPPRHGSARVREVSRNHANLLHCNHRATWHSAKF